MCSVSMAVSVEAEFELVSVVNIDYVCLVVVSLLATLIEDQRRKHNIHSCSCGNGHID